MVSFDGERNRIGFGGVGTTVSDPAEADGGFGKTSRQIWGQTKNVCVVVDDRLPHPRPEVRARNDKLIVRIMNIIFSGNLKKSLAI